MNDLESRLRAALREETAEVAAPQDLADDMVDRGIKVRRRRRTAVGLASLAVVAALLPLWKTIDTSSGTVSPAQTPTPTGATQAPPSTGSTASTSSAQQVDHGWVSGPIHVIHTPRFQAKVVGVRVGEHPRFDRAVIDFSGAIPSYQVDSVPRLVLDASGRRAPLPGASYLSISLKPAIGHSDAGSTVGTPRQVLSMPTLRGYIMTGDYEGVVSLGLALSHPTSIRVLELKAPTRLIIDVHH